MALSPHLYPPLNISPPPSFATSLSGQIVYLGQIVSYLRKRKRGCLPTLPSSFPKSSHSFSFSTFFHPRPLHFSFQPFNQSATIRADRVMENNWGGVTGGLTLELWGGVGIGGRPRVKNRHPSAVSCLGLCSTCSVRKCRKLSFLYPPLFQ